MHFMFRTKRFNTRPLVAARKQWTKRLNNFGYILLKLLLSKIKIYVKEDFDFLKKYKRNFSENPKLVFLDVTSLYANIPHELELEAIEHWSYKHPELIHSRFNKFFILKAFKLVLNNFRNCYSYYCCSNSCNVINRIP